MFENEVTDLCCSTCKAEVTCKEKCECWTFAKKGAEYVYNNCNAKLTKAKEILRKFLDAKSIEETCVAESEADKFLSEMENDKGE